MKIVFMDPIVPSSTFTLGPYLGCELHRIIFIYQVITFALIPIKMRMKSLFWAFFYTQSSLFPTWS
jgi:hypothetical protein